MKYRFKKGQSPLKHKEDCKCFRCDKNYIRSPEIIRKIADSNRGQIRLKIRGKNSPSWKGGLPECSDCSKQLKSYGAKKCREHSILKGSLNSMWKGGNFKCLDCKKELGSRRSKRCYKCASQLRRGRNMPKCIKCGKILSNYNCKLCKIHFLQKQFINKNETSIEKKLYKELKRRGFLFEKQYLVNGKFLVDAYIPSLNLIIEADGDYWHNLPKTKKKDKAENAYLTKCGYKLLRLSEHKINNVDFVQSLSIN